MRFCFGVHNHQPVGNFGWVIENINNESYRPFFTVLYQFPAVKFSLHLSGVLLDWYRAHDPETLRLIRKMVDRGQVEILGGGFYEPVLAAIPRRDRAGQIQKHRKAVRSIFGTDARGLWLAERVWEPDLVEDLAGAGIEYTVLDDRLFLTTGFQPEELGRYFVTESGGAYLKVFPIDMKSRHLVPFRPLEDFEAHLKETAEAGREGLFYFDDGEKFGSWPGTHEWVYTKGWLVKFLEKLVSLAPGVKTSTYSEMIDETPSGGICYLPSASYAEMEDWALPARGFKEIQAFRSRETLASPSPYVRGSIWKNFLVKYPESNRMHKSMLELSALLADAAPRLAPRVRERLTEALYAAQCNDAYWHGVFGGLYLPHLRQGIWSRLCEVRKHFNRARRDVWRAARMVRTEWGAETAVFDSPHVAAVWKLERSAALSQFLFLDAGTNVLSCLSRMPEGYHFNLRERVEQLRRGGLAHLGESLGFTARLIEDVAAGLFQYDGYERGAFIDRYFHWSDSAQRDFTDCKLDGLEAPAGTAKLSRGKLELRYAGEGLETAKTVEFLPRSGFRVSYKIRNRGAGAPDLAFGTEINFYLAVCKLETQEASRIVFRDEVTKTRVTITASQADMIWHYPVVTRHLSESGLHDTYQGTCVMPLWHNELRNSTQKKPFEAVVTFEVGR